MNQTRSIGKLSVPADIVRFRAKLKYSLNISYSSFVNLSRSVTVNTFKYTIE